MDDQTRVRPHLDQSTMWILDAAEATYAAVSKYLPHSITLGQLRVLTHIVRSQLQGSPTTATELSEYLDMPRSTVSRIVHQFLGDDGLHATPDPQDDRKVRLTFSEEYLRRNDEWVTDMLKMRTRLAKDYPDAYKIGPESASFFG